MHDADQSAARVEGAEALDRARRIDDPPPRIVRHLIGDGSLVELEIAPPERQPGIAIAGLKRTDFHGHDGSWNASCHVAARRCKCRAVQPAPFAFSQRFQSPSDPLKALRSTLPSMPGTRPVAVYCQKRHGRST